MGRGGDMREDVSERVSRSLTGKFGPLSRRWKGQEASYFAKHMWIIKHVGKASKCSFDPTHTAKRFEWANVSGEYLRDASDYIELCPSCHRKFDRKSHCKNGHYFKEETTYIDPRGFRGCRICRNESLIKYKRSKQNAAN